MDTTKTERITSLQNPHIKQAVLLSVKPSGRRTHSLFVIEGQRELTLALQAGYQIETFFVCREIYDAASPLPQCRQAFEITKQVFEKMVYRNNSEGFLAVAYQKSHTLANVKLCKNPFILVIESVEKPGNIGAILRTADAAKLDLIIVCDPHCDIYNPNTVRASIGTLFTNQVACATKEETFAFLTKNNINILAADLQAADCVYNADMQKPTAVAFGAESAGLSDFWLKNAHQRIKIPMRGAIDSLNVSVSAAVITFEAMRQRNFC